MQMKGNGTDVEADVEKWLHDTAFVVQHIWLYVPYLGSMKLKLQKQLFMIFKARFGVQSL